MYEHLYNDVFSKLTGEDKNHQKAEKTIVDLAVKYISLEIYRLSFTEPLVSYVVATNCACGGD